MSANALLWRSDALRFVHQLLFLEQTHSTLNCRFGGRGGQSIIKLGIKVIFNCGILHLGSSIINFDSPSIPCLIDKLDF